MRIKRQKWIVAAILTGVLALGFLAGISASRPLKEVFPKRSAVEDPNPEEFVLSFQRRLSSDLTLTDAQKPAVEEEIRKMTQRIRSIQRNFIPQITQAMLDSIDEIMPLLDEEQQRQLERRKDGIRNSLPMRTLGLGRNGPGRPNGPPRGPGEGGRRPWGDGPPPWVRNQDQGTPPDGRPATQAGETPN